MQKELKIINLTSHISNSRLYDAMLQEGQKTNMRTKTIQKNYIKNHLIHIVNKIVNTKLKVFFNEYKIEFIVNIDFTFKAYKIISLKDLNENITIDIEFTDYNHYTTKDIDTIFNSFKSDLWDDLFSIKLDLI